MTKQIYLHYSGTWATVISETPNEYVAKDIDGVMTYVIKDGSEFLREKEKAPAN
jgi:hypothetical protein